MDDMNDITERLHHERDAIATTDADDGLRNVRHIVRRRRRRSAIVGVAAAGALLVVGIAALGLVDDDSPGTIVSATLPPPPSITFGADTVPPPVDDPETGSDVEPRMLQPIVGSANGSELLDVTDGLRAVAVDNMFFDFEVPWDGGFLVGTSGYSSEPWRAFFSADGRTWEPRDLRPGVSNSGRDIVAIDGRLVILSSPYEYSGAIPMIASTTDLETWTLEELPVTAPENLPAAVQFVGGATELAVNDDGWAAIVHDQLRFDAGELASQRLGRPVTGYSQAESDDGISVLPDPEEAGGSREELLITWDELEADVGADIVEAVRNPSPPTVWLGTWGGAAPIRYDIPTALDGSSLERMMAVRDGFVAIRSQHEFRPDGPPRVTEELVAELVGDDGEVVWTVLDPPIAESVVSVFPLDGDVGVFAETADSTLRVYRVDTTAQTWTPIEIPGLPTSARDIRTTETGVVLLDAAPELEFDTGPTTSTLEKNGLRYTSTFDAPMSSYELTSIETGEVLVSESINLLEVEGSFELAFEHLAGGLGSTTISDPETGEVLIEFSADEILARMTPGVASPNEPWIVATSDGLAWFVGEEPPASPDARFSVQSLAAVSGTRLLMMTDPGDWYLVDLG